MQSREQIYDALRQADAAGDADAVRTLAGYLDQQPAAPEMHTFITNGKKFEAPANATDEQIRAAAVAANGGDQRFTRSAIRRGEEFAQTPDTRPTSFVQGVAEGSANVWNHAADWVEGGLDAVGNAIGLGDVGHTINSIGPSLGMAGSVDQAEQQQAVDFGNSPNQGSGLGRFTGEVIGTLPLAALPGGMAVQGAAGGALLSDKNTVGGVAADAGLGAAGAVLGGSAMRGAARLVAPAVNPLVQRLTTEGISLTPGQIAGAPTGAGQLASAGGRAMRKTEDVVSSVPLAGAAVQNAQARGVLSLNRAAINRALRPIGERLGNGINAGHDAIRYAGDRLSAAYGQVLPTLNGQADNAFARRLRTIVARADLPPGYEAESQSVVNEALKAFRPHNPPTGNATPITVDQFAQLPPTEWRFNGRRLRDASERLGDIGAGFRASDEPYKRILGDVAQQLRDQLHALARRTNPASASRLRDIDRGYASLVRAERAASGTTDGVFTPRQYDAAVRGVDRSARRRQSARGLALDQDLSSAGSQVMANTAAQGGSKDVNSIVALTLLGSRALSGDPAAMAGVGAVVGGSAAYSRPGQAAIQALMTRNPGLTAQNAARLLQYAGRAAPIAAPAAVSSARQQTP